MKLLNILANKKHIIYLVLITILYFILFCQNLDSYHFLDFFETKYTTIAKEMIANNSPLTPTLNGANNFDTPPLFFWIINMFCFIFGKIAPEIVRIPNVLCLYATMIFMFFCLKKIIDERFAFITVTTFITNIAIIFFAHLASTDILFLSTTISAILCAYLNILNEKTDYKILALMYVMIGLSTLSVGIIGFIMPFLTTHLLFLIAQKGKELIKPKSIIISFTALSILILPWHIYMICTYGNDFIRNYVTLPNYKYLIANLATLFFVIFPYILVYKRSSFDVKINFVKSFLLKVINPNFKKLREIQWDNCRLKNKFLVANTLTLIIGLIFALIFQSKQPYLILFLMFPISCITSHYIDNFLKQRFENKNVFKIISLICIIPILTSIFLIFSNHNTFGIQKEIKEIFFMPIVIISYIIPIFVILFCIVKNKIMLIVTYLITMIYLSGIITPYIYTFISTTTGENDLINFATITKNQNKKLLSFISKQKYIITYYYDKNVEFHKNTDYDFLKEYMKKNQEANVIIKIKDLNNIEKEQINYNLVATGKKYCLIEYSPDTMIEEEVEITTY